MLNKKLIYLSVFLVLALFLVSACNEAVGRKPSRYRQPDIRDQAPIYNQTNITKTTGSIYAFSNPSVANLYIDDLNLSRGLTPLRIDGLSVGSHMVYVTKNGYYTYQDVKSVYADKVTYVNVTLTQIVSNQTSNNQTNISNQTSNNQTNISKGSYGLEI
nr:hypothetical protein [uncultured archaeon]